MDSESASPAEPGRLYRFAWGFYLAVALAGCLWVGLTRRLIPLSLFIDRTAWWRDALLGLGVGLALLGLWWGAERLSREARQLGERLGSLLGPLSGAEATALALLSGFAEELFFRGAVQGSLGWVIAAGLFGLLHSGPGRTYRMWTLFALLAGIVFGLLMQWRGNLLAPILAHTLVNAVNLRRLARRADRFGRLAGDADGGKES